ncbi:MAG: hypothetical protein K6D91_05995 [Prevotella sp.]|nr:hypothetical protein [Prevotella sp.]
MSIEDIISAVRNCIDEGNYNDSYISASSGDFGTMNDLIKSKVDDALRWLCLYAPVRMLRGGGLVVKDKSTSIPCQAEDSTPYVSGRNVAFSWNYDDIKDVLLAGQTIRFQPLNGSVTLYATIEGVNEDEIVQTIQQSDASIELTQEHNGFNLQDIIGAFGSLTPIYKLFFRVPSRQGVELPDFELEYDDVYRVENKVVLPNTAVRLLRVKCENWHRAVTEKTLLTEDSDEYLQLMDSHGAEATDDRPQAALIENENAEIELWPAPNSDDDIDLAYIAMPTYDIDTDVPVPSLAFTAFTYYIAYLILVAYGDARAEGMLRIANQSIGATVQ